MRRLRPGARCGAWRDGAGRALEARAGAPFLVLVLLSPLLLGCGSGQRASTCAGAPPIDLPVVGTLGRAPAGEATIVVDVDADGRITVDGRGPMGLVTLRDELQERTADPAWREPDRSSRKILLLRADAALPWLVPVWIQQVACDPRVRLYRIFLGARARAGGAVGALGWTLPRDGSGPVPPPDSEGPPRLAVRLGTHGGPPSEPAAILPHLVRAAGEHPFADVVVELKMPPPGGCVVPTGFVAEVFDVVLAAGVREVRLEGAVPPLPGPATDGEEARFDPDDVDALLAYVARLKARRVNPTIRIGAETLGRLPAGERLPPDQGCLDVLYGAGVESEEPLPESPTRVAAALDTPIEEELLEVEEETKEISPDEVDGAEEPVIPDAEITDVPFEGPARSGPFPGAWPAPRAFAPRLDAPRREDAVARALAWLAAHQSPDGRWESRGFAAWCDGAAVPEAARASGAGSEARDVGTTGLALFAFLGAGYTNRGPHAYARVVSKGLRYLKSVQEADGSFGPRSHDRFLMDHAAATLALVEAYGMTGSPIFKGSAQRGLDFLCAARDPSGGWRVARGPSADAILEAAWMAAPLVSARLVNQDAEQRGGPPPLALDEPALETLRTWLESDPGPRSDASEAAALWLGIVLGQDPRRDLAALARAKALAARAPTWGTADGGTDLPTWYFGTLGAFQVGADVWKVWQAALQGEAVPAQRMDTTPCAYRGSWDPFGAWGRRQGRVASTAMMALCLEVTYRYDRTNRVR